MQHLTGRKLNFILFSYVSAYINYVITKHTEIIAANLTRQPCILASGFSGVVESHRVYLCNYVYVVAIGTPLFCFPPWTRPDASFGLLLKAEEYRSRTRISK